MAVNPDIAGKQYPPAESYLVGREKVREFAAATQATNPIYFDLDTAKQAGFDDLIAPPTFAVVVQQRSWNQMLDDPEAGVVLENIVHGDQRFSHVRPIVAGDELTPQLTITSVKTLGGNSMVGCLTEIRDAAGELVSSATSTLVVRGDS